VGRRRRRRLQPLGRVSVNNPAIPGLPTQAQLTPVLPAGRALTSVKWKSSRSDCVFSAPTGEQTSITCGVTATGSATVTATAVDSTGATIVRTSPLTFATTAATKRAVTVAATLNGAPDATDVCLTTATPVRVEVRDAASNLPVRGLSATAARKVGTAAPSVSTATTAADGVAAPTVTVTAPAGVTTVTGVTVSTATTAAGPFNAGTGNTIGVTGAKCSPSLTASINRTAAYYGDPAVVTGALTRTLAAGGTAAVTGARLSITSTAGTKVSTLATVTTDATGAFTGTVKLTADGALRVVLAPSSAYVGTSFDLGSATVTLPATRLTAASSTSALGYGQTASVTGTLARDAGGVVTPLSNATVTVTVTAATVGAKPVTVGSGRTSATGAFTVNVIARTGGALAVTYAGAAGQPAAAQALGTLAVESWQTQVTLTAPGTVTAGISVTATGTATRHLVGGATVPARRGRHPGAARQRDDEGGRHLHHEDPAQGQRNRGRGHRRRRRSRRRDLRPVTVTVIPR
jgi:hypothetical protein